jgi:hypothetical protein
MISKLKNILIIKKSAEWPTLTFVWACSFLFVGLFITLLTIGTYISLASYVIYILQLQDLLVFLTLAIARIVHRSLASESYYFSAYSYMLSGLLLVFITAVLSMPYTLENAAITGENAWEILQYPVVIKSTLQMGAMYLSVGMHLIDALISFFLYLSKQEEWVKSISISMQVVSIIFVSYFMQVAITIG